MLKVVNCGTKIISPISRRIRLGASCAKWILVCLLNLPSFVNVALIRASFDSHLIFLDYIPHPSCPVSSLVHYNDIVNRYPLPPPAGIAAHRK